MLKELNKIKLRLLDFGGIIQRKVIKSIDEIDELKDKDVNMTFMLADLSVIRQVPDLKNTPDWNASFTQNKTACGQFPYPQSKIV